MPDNSELLFKNRFFKVLFVYAISISFVVTGIYWEDISEVIVNGSILCLSCIGIG